MEIYRLSGVLIFFSCTPFAVAESHSHYFFTTITNNSTYGIPSYFLTRTIDDITLFWYDGDNGIVEPRVPWFQSTSSSLLNVSQHEIQLFQTVMDHLNQTEGYHILQILEGCTLYDNGTIEAVYSHHYDGKPFLSLNMDTGNWTADVPEAQYFRDYYNHNVTMGIRNGLLNNCILHIGVLLLLGKRTFARKEQPVVSVTQIPMGGASSTLDCRAYGHYPKDIVIVWHKNGQEVSEGVTKRLTLPLPDFLYLTSLSLNITPSADDIYTCKVFHSSYTQPYLQDWKESDGPLPQTSVLPNGGVIAICLAAILVLVIVAFGSVSLGKRRRNFTTP